MFLKIDENPYIKRFFDYTTLFFILDFLLIKELTIVDLTFIINLDKFMKRKMILFFYLSLFLLFIFHVSIENMIFFSYK